MHKTLSPLVEYVEMTALFFLQAMAWGMWVVPLSTVLEAYHLQHLRPFAFATSAVAAFVSPLVFGAMADRHASPVSVLRGLAVGCAATVTLVTWSIQQGWPSLVVLGLIQLFSLCAVPSGSIATTIVFSRLKNSQKEFGPIRASATFGWMCGCWVISLLGADASTIAGYSGAVFWLILAGFTFFLPSVAPPKPTHRVTFKERMGWDALVLLKHHDHRVVFVTAALFSIPLAAFYPFTPPHLRDLGFERTSAWMSMGQITEIIAMFALAGLFASWRLKWIFSAGLAFGVIRFLFCAWNTKASLLTGITMHGLSFTLFFITAQIYLNERVDQAWRARAQALMSLMISGVGNLLGYLGSGFWLRACQQPQGMRWTLYWGGISMAVLLVFIYFTIAYHGQSSGLRRAAGTEGEPKPQS